MVGVFKKTYLFLLILLTSVYFPIQAKAQTASDFLAASAQNNVISNENFIDINSMDVAAIQAFLVANNSYLKDYIDTTETSVDAVAENGKSAAQIIYDAAHGLYGAAVGTSHEITLDSSTGTINPKVILVFLQKEQSLVSRTTLDNTALARAMGYSCPDASGCNPTYAGFAMQVGWGAWQLRYNYEAAGKGVDWWNENYPGSDSTCYVGQSKTVSDYTGSYNVTFTNAATASVYRYTPHVFDSAYNVWNLFHYTYFSGSTPPVTPTAAAPPRKTGDANSDGSVGIADLSLLGDTWGQNITANTGADFNSDGVVNIADLSILGDNWGQ